MAKLRCRPIVFTLIFMATPFLIPQFLNITAAQAGESGFVGGTTPSQRPAKAPAIKTFNRTKKWHDAALTGVSKPYPPSLVFLDNQGGWFNPFTHAGMVDKYDLRNWHK